MPRRRRKPRPRFSTSSTYADVAKAEQEGAFVFYCHENEAGTAAIVEGFGKDFPKIKTSYVRAQTGALYNKILSERAAGRFDVDMLQLSDVAPALDFQKRGGYELYARPEHGRLQARTLSIRPAPISGPASPSAASPTTTDQGEGRGGAEELEGSARSEAGATR